MAKFVATDWDEDGNPIDGYYEEDSGTDYSNEGRKDSATLNEYGQWITADGSWLRDATPEELSDDTRTMNPDGSVTDSAGNVITPAPDNSDLDPGAPSVPGDGTIDGNPVADTESSWEKYAKQFGLINKDGSYNASKILALTGGAIGVVGAATQPTQTIKSLAELKAGLPAQSSMNATGWSAEQLANMTRPMQTGSALQRVYAADMASPLTPGQTTKKYAEGGEIEGALTQAFAGGVNGEDGGQSDLVSIQVSPGEYVMDAESVSALGDGNTAAGIAKLDELRAQLRAQKRSAPNDKIPPQAQGPLSYMQGA